MQRLSDMKFSQKMVYTADQDKAKPSKDGCVIEDVFDESPCEAVNDTAKKFKYTFANTAGVICEIIVVCLRYLYFKKVDLKYGVLHFLCLHLLFVRFW